MYGAVRLHPRRGGEQVYGDRPREVDRPRPAREDLGFEALLGPRGPVVEERGGQRDGPLEPDAAGAEGALGLLEQVLPAELGDGGSRSA